MSPFIGHCRKRSLIFLSTKTDALTGSIEVGKRADLVVLDQNLFEILAEKICETEVLATLVDGHVVYGELP